MTQIKLRRDTAANFTSVNPVLGLGEPAYETDTKKLKIGDGTTAYNSLSYFSMTDEFATYREKYGAPSDSVPVINTGNSITIKANVSIETPNGTLTNATDMTYTYDFLTDRVLFVTENDYYHAYAVYYGGKEPSPVGEQIFWFNNNVWTMISGNGTKTVFNTQKITPIAKIYQVDGTVKNIDYSSYTKTSAGGGGGSTNITATLPLKIVDGVISLEVDGQTIQIVDGKLTASSTAPANMVTTDTAQTISGNKEFTGITTISNDIKFTVGKKITTPDGQWLMQVGGGFIGIGTSMKPLQTYDGSNYYLHNKNVIAGDGIKITEPSISEIEISSTGGTGMPSNKYVDLTLGASGSTYTVPANGYLTYALSASSNDMWFELTGSLGTGSYGGGNTTYGYHGFMPVKKGEVITISYQNCSTSLFRFVYAEGEV